MDNITTNTKKAKTGVRRCLNIDLQKEIKGRFNALLRERGKRQNDLVVFLGKNKSTISQICNGIIIPSNELMLKISKDFFCIDSRLIWDDSIIKNLDQKIEGEK